MGQNLKQTKISAGDDTGILAASKLLEQGDVVALPTETVYGLSGIAFNAEAVHKIFSAKGRPLTDPLITHVGRIIGESLAALNAHGVIDLEKFSTPQKEVSAKLMSAFWPGPLTLLLPRGKRITDLITAGHENVAVRMPRHEVFLGVLDKLGKPLVAPSANLFGRTSPTSAQHVMHQLNGRIPLILDGGDSQVGVESTIVRIESDGSLTLLRPGGVSVSELEQHLPGAIAKAEATTTPVTVAPGLLESHYAPKTPTFLVNEATLGHIETKDKSIGVLLTSETNWISERIIDARRLTLEVLPYDLEGRRAAQGLFAALHRLDHLELDLILVEDPPSEGFLWLAIKDRLKRAAKKL